MPAAQPLAATLIIKQLGSHMHLGRAHRRANIVPPPFPPHLCQAARAGGSRTELAFFATPHSTSSASSPAVPPQVALLHSPMGI